MGHFIIQLSYDVMKGVSVFIIAHWITEHGVARSQAAFQKTPARQDILSHFESHPGLSVAHCELDQCANYS